MSNWNEPQSEYVEAFADAVAESGMPDVAGRALGHLLVSEPACQTAAEVAAALGETEREVAMMLEALARSGMLEAVALPDRQARCYAVQTVDVMLEDPVRRAGAMRRVAERGQAIARDDDARDRLAEMAVFYSFLEQELGQLVARWRQARQKSRSRRV